MKSLRTTTLLFLAFAAGRCAAQADTSSSHIAFGFSLGTTYAMLDIRDAGQNTRSVNGAGFRMGTLTEWQLDRSWALANRMELSFNPTRVEVMDGSDVADSYKVYPALLDIAVHVERGWNTKAHRLYVLAGPMLRVPASSRNDAFSSPVDRADVAVDIGIGREKRLSNFRVAWELRYAHGLRDLQAPGRDGDLHFRTLMLSLCFKG